MSLRTLASSFLTAMGSGSVVVFTLAEFHFDSGTLYLTDCPHDVSYAGQTWVSAYGIAAIGDTTEMAGEATGLVFTLSGVNSTLMSLAFNEPMQGRAVVMRLAALSAGTVYADDNMWTGTLDVPTITRTENGTMQISISAENPLSRWDKPNLVRHSHEDQQRFYPGDMFYSFAARLTDATIIWPDAGFFQK